MAKYAGIATNRDEISKRHEVEIVVMLLCIGTGLSGFSLLTGINRNRIDLHNTTILNIMQK